MSDYTSCFKRVEKKYMLTARQAEAMRQGMAPYVKPDAYSHYTICNIYYDTEDYQLIRTSLEKPVYKEKLRVRSYGVPRWDSPVFIELKKKFDGVVYKRRITVKEIEGDAFLKGKSAHRTDQIGKEIEWFMKRYRPKPQVFIGYDREAYAGTENPDLRITFDTNIRGRDWDVSLGSGDYGELVIPREKILMELKIPGSAPLWLSRLLSENGIFPQSFSKYGTYYEQMVKDEHPYGLYGLEKFGGIYEFYGMKEAHHYA